MSVETEPVVEVDQDEAAALASALAGYNARGSKTPPAEVSSEQAAQPGSDAMADAHQADQPSEGGDQDQGAEAETAPPAPDLFAELAAMKEKVKALSSEQSPETVRKMNGAIGDINRRLIALEPEAKPAAAPVDDELTAAIAAAETSAQEFPELAGPLVAAVKLLKDRQAAQPAGEQMNAEAVTAIIAKQRERDAIDALVEEHPDYETVRETPAFKAWNATKPAEFQNRLQSTWNPAVVANALTEFKASIQTKQKKQERLSAAITPKGVPAPAAPSKVPDEQGLYIGYAKASGRHFNKR